MSIQITNNTNESLQEVHELINEFFPYAQKRLGFNKPVSLSLMSDPNNASNPLGKTAYYNPNADQISIYTDNRHPKDILRSFSHELVHHNQNCRGEFSGDQVTEEGYAQKDEHLRNLELEAYTEGNIILRDWEDGIKSESRNKTMNEQILRNSIRKALKLYIAEQTAAGLTPNTHDSTRCDEIHSGKTHNEWAQDIRLSETEELEERRRLNTPDRRGDMVPADRQQPLEETDAVDEGEEVVEEVEELEERRRGDSEDRRGNNLPVDRIKPVQEKKSFEQLKEERLYNALVEKWIK